MTIRDKQRHMDTHWDWGCLDGCFSNSKASPIDIDGMIERRGKFLVIETKGPSGTLDGGQLITFKQLAKLGVFTVIVVWGNEPYPERLRVMSPNGDYTIEGNMETLRGLVRDWWGMADGS